MITNVFKNSLYAAVAVCLFNNAYSMETPQGFSWVCEEENQRIAGLPKPHDAQTIEFLKNQNIGLVVSLEHISTELAALFNDDTFKRLAINVVDFGCPTIDDVDRFIQAADVTHAQGKGVAVHCLAGIGRTGTLLACWFVAKKGITAEEAIAKVRELRKPALPSWARPVETSAQEAFVAQYHEHIQKKK